MVANTGVSRVENSRSALHLKSIGIKDKKLSVSGLEKTQNADAFQSANRIRSYLNYIQEDIAVSVEKDKKR